MVEPCRAVWKILYMVYTNLNTNMHVIFAFTTRTNISEETEVFLIALCSTSSNVQLSFPHAFVMCSCMATMQNATPILQILKASMKKHMCFLKVTEILQFTYQLLLSHKGL